MSEVANHPNITVLLLDPASRNELETTVNTVKTLLNGENLNVLVNAGDVGLEPSSGSTPEQTVQGYNTHLFASRTLSLALEDQLIASRGAIINLTSVEMREHERSISKLAVILYIVRSTDEMASEPPCHKWRHYGRYEFPSL